MQGRGFIFFLLMLAGLEYSGRAAQCATRNLSVNTATTGMILEVAINLTFSETTPYALILAETLPDGLQFQDAAWNGKPFAASVQDGQTFKWFFGPGGKAVSDGILAYHARILTESSQKVFFAGSLQYPGAGAVQIAGERILWLNPAVYSAPGFTPVSGTVFEEELRVSLYGETADGAEIFLCFGEPESWDDWQLYEEAFTIQHSQQLQAQTWFADGRASLTAHAEYHRRGNCEIELQRGWNLMGIPLELSAQESLKLQEMQRFGSANAGSHSSGINFICGQVFWVFSEKDRCLLLTGIEPFQRGVRSERKAGWEAISLVGLEEDIMLKVSEAFWTWEDNRYRLAKHLKPGKGYWRFKLPSTGRKPDALP